MITKKKVDELEREKRNKRINLSNREDEIASKRRKLLEDLDSRMIKQTSYADVFIVELSVT